MLQSPSLSLAAEKEVTEIKAAPIEPGSPRESPKVVSLFEGQYGPIRAISTHPTLNLFALGGDSGKIL